MTVADIENFAELLAYLRQTGRIALGETPEFQCLVGGVSNRTVLVNRPDGQSWVLKQALRRLRVEVEWLSDPVRIEREAMGMQRLAEIAPAGAITPLIFLDAESHLLAMQAVPQPHENWKAVLMAGRLDLSHVAQFAQLIAAIHLGGWQRCDSLAGEFDDRRFFESLRVEPYYLYTASKVPAAAGFLNDLVASTRAKRYTLVHGDYSPKNILLRQGRLILLDHEVIHFGDGAFDLGFSLAHLLGKAHHLRPMRAAFAEAANHYWRTYAGMVRRADWAGDIESRAIHHTLGCLLARCRGRSPLEYLDAKERDRQEVAVVELINERPGTVAELIVRFLDHIGEIA